MAALVDDIDGPPLSRSGSSRRSVRQATLQKKRQSLHRRQHSEQHPQQNAHPKCQTCGALVNQDMKSLNQPKLAVTCAAVRRIQHNKAYNPADFEILLLPPSGDKPFYLIPEDYMHIGENGELAAQRTLRDVASIVGMRARAVAFNGQYDRRSHHVVTTAYLLSCSEFELPRSGKFYSLFHVVSNKSAFPLGHGHRELLYEVEGYLRLQCRLETIDILFTAGTRLLVEGTKNALFGQRFKEHASDRPAILTENSHFQAEILRNMARPGRQSFSSHNGPRIADTPMDGAVTHVTDTDPSTPLTLENGTPPIAIAEAITAGAGVGVGGASQQPSQRRSTLRSTNGAGGAGGAGGEGTDPVTPTHLGGDLDNDKSTLFRKHSTRATHLSVVRGKGDDDDDDDVDGNGHHRIDREDVSDEDEDDDVVQALRGLRTPQRRATATSSTSHQSTTAPRNTTLPPPSNNASTLRASTTGTLERPNPPGWGTGAGVGAASRRDTIFNDTEDEDEDDEDESGSNHKGGAGAGAGNGRGFMVAVTDKDEEEEDGFGGASGGFGRGFGSRSTRDTMRSQDGGPPMANYIPDGVFNPLADDLDADFTNPLAEEA